MADREDEKLNPMLALSDRARQRAEVREQRATERAASSQERADRRATEREQASRDRQAAREARQANARSLAAPRATSDNEGGPPAPKRRPSGSLRRTGELRLERDVRNYKTEVDARRIRELAKRGAKIDGLATVFKMTVEEIEAVLATTD